MKLYDFWVPICLLLLTLWATACDGQILGTLPPTAEAAPATTAGTANGGGAGSPNVAEMGAVPTSGAAGMVLDGTSLGGASGGGDASQAPMSGAAGSAGNGGNAGSGGGFPVFSGTLPKKQKLRAAFIGDSANGSAFVDVLRLIKSEQADFIVHEGDFDYHSDPDAFFATVDDELGASYPYFAAVGNHDAPAWEGYAKHLEAHLAANHVELDDPDLLDQKYAFDYQGVGLLFVGENGKNSEFADYIDERFAQDDHLWRVCNWHKNQKAMQIGGKTDEMGWDVYENCRKAGALIMTGHEHSYERTKTLTSFEKQTVDDTCSARNDLCVGPGRSFAVVTGLGGNSVRPQERCEPFTYPYGCNGEWAFIYSSDQSAKHGALFIDFWVDGSPAKAHGYFKNVDQQVVDDFYLTKDSQR